MEDKRLDRQVEQAFGRLTPDVIDSVLSDCRRQKGSIMAMSKPKRKGGLLRRVATVAAALSGTFATPAAAYAFLVFILLYVPCVAAVSTLYKEMNSLKWTARSVLWQLCAAWIVSFLVFQIGSLFF